VFAVQSSSVEVFGQEEPAPKEHSEGAGGQEHFALDKSLMQTSPIKLHEETVEVTTQPLTSWEHLTSVLLSAQASPSPLDGQ
jgi:hypothetical protein